MHTNAKLHPGQAMEPLTFRRLGGDDYTFGAPGTWQALFIFRGQHCPICKAYLREIEQRRDALAALGVSVAVSADTEAQETDHRFPEPALFVVNPDGVLQLVDVANAPFLRPDLDRLVRGLGFVIEKNDPIRGTHQ